MSSLAKQLKQLQIPSHLVGPATKSQTHKASLLFSGREAADIDNETILSLARNGLEELKLIEPAFDSFDESLFGEHSKKMERSLQNKEFNERLDKQISLFLKHLSPYFLLKPAQKALEWLIRRYRIHISNEDALMSCILPYHETKLFVRVVQLLKIRNPSSKWNWLEPLQKSGSSLARTTILQRCSADFAFLSQICEMVPEALSTECPISSLRVLFSFYASTVVGALEIVDRVNEDIITRLLPYIIKGLKSGVAEYKGASYMIIAQLCVKCTLEENLVKSLIESICKHLSSELVMEGLICVTSICQTQSRRKMPKKAFKYLMQLQNVSSFLCQLSAAHDISALLQVLLPQLVSSAVRECMQRESNTEGDSCLIDCLCSLMKDLEMESVLVKTVSRTLLEEYCKARVQLSNDAASCETFNTTLKALPQFLEKRYPTELEGALEEYLEGLKSTGADSDDVEDNVTECSQWTLEFMSLALSGFKSQVVPDSSATLTLSLHHPKSEVRQMAVKHLHTLLKDQKTSPCGEEFVCSALLARLSDDDPSVACAVLDMEQVLIKSVPCEDLAEQLFELLNKTGAEWTEASEKAVTILTGPELTADNPALLDRVVCGQLSLFFLNQRTHTQAVKLATKVSQTSLAEKHPLLNEMKKFVKKKEWKACKDSSDPEVLAVGNRLLISWLADHLSTMVPHKRVELVSKLSEYTMLHPTDTSFQLLLSCCLGRLVAMTTVTQEGLDLCGIILNVIIDSLQGVDKLKRGYTQLEDAKADQMTEQNSEGLVPLPLISNYLQLLNKQKTKKTAVARAAINLWLLGNLIRNIPADKAPMTGPWWNYVDGHSTVGNYTKMLLSVFEVLANSAGSTLPKAHQATSRKLLQDFIQHHLPDRLTLLKFLALVWSDRTAAQSTSDGHASGSPPLLQIQSLHIGSVCLGVLDESDLGKAMQKKSTVVASLLVPVCSHITAMRKSAIACLKNLQSSRSKPLHSPVGTLVALLVENSEELEADSGHLQRLFTTVFRSLSSVDSPFGKMSPKLKSKKKAEQKILEAMLDYITSHAISMQTPVHVQKVLLVTLGGTVTQEMLYSCLPRLKELVTKSLVKGLDSDESCCLQLLIKKFTPVTAPLLESEPHSWQLVERILSLKVSVSPGHPPPAVSFLDQISDQFFQAIPSRDIQQKVLAALLDLLLKTKDVLVMTKANSALDKITIAADQFIVELCKLTTDKKTPKRKKTKRSVTPEEHSNEELEPWHRITIILELLQCKKNITNQEQMIPTLFFILARCVEMDVPEQANCDYIEQLLLTAILNICQSSSSEGKPVSKDFLPENQFNVELVVQCIRVSENPQTHHHALLLLAAAAKLFPEKVLHNVMSIFTFMGANVLRQDDSYSFQVISRTVETVIPALIQAGEKQQLPKLHAKGAPPVSLDDIVAMVTRVFVDASPHVPEHRRVPVFSHLIATIGAEDFLHTTIILLLERFVVSSDTPSDDEAPVQSPLGVDFCVVLCQEFDPQVQAEGMLKLLKYIARLPAEKHEGYQHHETSRKSTALFSSPVPLFNVQAHSSKHLRQFKFTALGLLPAILSSDNFATKVAGLDETVKNGMDQLYLGFIEELLKFVTSTAKYAESQAQDTSKKFWRALLHKAYDIIDEINQLLPGAVFIGVIRRLLHNDNATVRRKAMELLNTKLGRLTVQEDQVKELRKLVEDLMSLVQGSESGEETAINRQTALYSLKLLARMLAEQQPAAFTKVLEVSIEVFTNKNENIQVASNALLCLAEVCSGLKASAISFLPRFMPNLLKLLKPTSELRNPLLLLCAVVALHKVTETLPHFLSPYLVEILVRATCPILNGLKTSNSEEEPEKESTSQNQLRDRLAALRKDVARVISPRILIPAVSQCYSDIVEAGNQEAVLFLMDVVTESVTVMTKRDVTSHNEQLFKFFLVALDFRVTQHECEASLVDKTECSVIEAFLCLVMKMSEATFRPVFLKLVDWATRGNADKNRLLVFYRLCVSTSDKLKGLITLFAGYILKNCATLLDANNTAKTDKPFFTVESTESTADFKKACQLVNYILDCLQKFLLYAAKGFLDKERFDCLMQPIVDQLENQVGDNAEFQDRISGHVVPCLAQLAVAAGSDAYWKPLNYQVLLKTRHTSSQVRFAALKALEELHRQLGEEFIVLLLPESIPFLAELMEDECFEVEQQCQHVVSEIEGVLGEPLQKYFEP